MVGDPAQPGGHFRRKQEIAKGAMPGPASRAAVLVKIVKLPVRTIKARRIDGLEPRWEIFVDKRTPASEQLKKAARTVLKDFGDAVGAPDRKIADQYGLDEIWKDQKRRQEEWDSRQQGVPEIFRQELEGGWRFKVLGPGHYIEDVRGAMLRYCEAYWDVPASRKISRPGRRKALELNGAKVSELRNNLGLSQRALAQACQPEVSVFKIIRAEKGRATEGLLQNLATTFSRLGQPVKPRKLQKSSS